MFEHTGWYFKRLLIIVSRIRSKISGSSTFRPVPLNINGTSHILSKQIIFSFLFSYFFSLNALMNYQQILENMCILYFAIPYPFIVSLIYYLYCRQPTLTLTDSSLYTLRKVKKNYLRCCNEKLCPFDLSFSSHSSF